MLKKLFIFLVACSIMASAQGQDTGKKSRKHYYIEISDSTFVSAMPEQGATFKAYFKGDSLYKIETWFGFNFGEVRREYYYFHDTISLINETQKLYSATAVPKINADTIKATYSGRYIFKMGKLTDISQKGSYSISDTPSSKAETEAAFNMLASKYKQLAYEKRKKKKNRIRITEQDK